MFISNRSLQTSHSPIRKLEGLTSQIKAQGTEIYNLNIGQSDLPTPDLFIKALKNNINKPIEYAPSAGYKEALSAWRDYFTASGITFQEDEIIITIGASEALFFSFLVTMDIGDEIIVFEPFYANYKTFCEMSGIKIKPITLNINDGYKMPDNKNIEGYLTNKTKAILICNPVNPTGKVFTKEELSIIADIAEKHKLFLISDETYRGMTYENVKYVSMMDFTKVSQQTIIIDSVSKRFNLCGARIGCVASKNKKLIDGIIKYAQARLSAPTLEQLSVIPLLKNSEKYILPLIAEYQKRKEVINQALKEMKDISVYNPQGAFYMMIKLPVKDTEDFCRWLVEKFSINKQTLLLAPGNNFYITKGNGMDEVRLAFVLDSKKLKIAMNIFREGLKKYCQIISK